MKKENLSSVGIDFGSQALKAVRLDFDSGQPVLQQYIKLITSDDGTPFSDTETKEIIQANFKEWGLEKCQVHISMTIKDVIVRYLEVPKMNVSELRNSLQYEADRYLPFKLSDAYFDANILIDSLPKNEEQMWVVLVAVKKPRVDEKLKLLSDSNINIDSVDVTPIAVMNAFEAYAPQSMRKKAILLVDIGAVCSSVNIISEGTPYFTRDIDFGGFAVTQGLMGILNKKFGDAEQLKVKGEFKWEGPLLKLINSFISGIKTSIDYFEGKNEKTIESICMTGGSAGLIGLTEGLKKSLDRPVEVLNFKQGIDQSKIAEPAEFDKNSHEFAVSLGLAAKGKSE